MSSVYCPVHGMGRCNCRLDVIREAPKWSEPKELFPGVFEKTKYDKESDKFENIIYKEGGDKHFHGWLNPEKNDAGGEINKNH